MDARLLSQSYEYPNLSESADRVAGQLRGDRECPFSGVTKSGRVWRKVPESGARSVGLTVRGRLFHIKAPEKDIPVCNMSILGLGKLS